MQKILSLQVLRAIACLMVIFAHFLMDAKKYNIIPEMEFLTFMLTKGVDVFFFISGFIMVYIQSEKATQPISFLKNRALRIYPVYYEFLLLSFAVYLVNPLLFNNGSGNKTDILASFLLIPPKDGYLHLIHPAWTLVYEIFFYMIFATCLWILKKRYILGLIFYGFIVIILNYLEFKQSKYTNLLISPYILQFICVALYSYWLKYKNRVNLAFLIVIISFLANLNLVMSLLVITTIIAFEILKLYEKRFQFPNILILIGDASYTLYLTHMLVMSAIKNIIAKTGLLPYTPKAIWITLMLVSPIIFAILHYIIVEKWFYRKIKRQ